MALVLRGDWLYARAGKLSEIPCILDWQHAIPGRADGVRPSTDEAVPVAAGAQYADRSAGIDSASRAGSMPAPGTKFKNPLLLQEQRVFCCLRFLVYADNFVTEGAA